MGRHDGQQDAQGGFYRRVLDGRGVWLLMGVLVGSQVLNGDVGVNRMQSCTRPVAGIASDTSPECLCMTGSFGFNCTETPGMAEGEIAVWHLEVLSPSTHFLQLPFGRATTARLVKYPPP